MSAIEEWQQQTFDTVRRYSTRCKVRIDSHNSGAGADSDPVWLMHEVSAVQTSKSLKGIGQATVTLRPTNNWLNVIFPNDYINIYFDIGDGSGWVRTHFGFVDRIEETYQVSSDGTPETLYHIVSSDFQKAFENTNIYFNTHLAGRADFAGTDYAAPNLGGLALATRGIEAGGSPADILTNFILITLGFGSQFVLPPSYRPQNQRRLRQKRAEYVQGSLPEAARQAIERAGGDFEQLREAARRDVEGLAAQQAGQYSNEEERLRSLGQHFGLSAEQVDAAAANDSLTDVFTDRRIRELLGPTNTANQIGSISEGSLNILEGTTSDATSSLLDVVDTFTFVERRAIDGYLSSSPVWQQQGPLMSILKSLSNESMNELFFDLRPLSLDTTSEAFNYSFAEDDPAQQAYSREDDDVLGNTAGDGIPQGHCYTPAVVMREYPFSTIEGLDLRDVPLELRTESGEQRNLGVMFFGAIFSDRVNEPGRHVITMPNINYADRSLGGKSLALATKHLDVAVVHESEITRTQFGRSDAEHYNLFEFFSQGLLGEEARYYMHDLLPIATPIHIMRHGLRVRSITTRFAQFDLPVAQRTTQYEAAEDPAEPTPAAQVPPGDLISPVAPNALVRFRNSGQSQHGYREKVGGEFGPAPGMWCFHQGIDIVAFQGGAEKFDIPIRCVADGEVVISAPEGVYGGYGDVVVVKHRFDGIDEPIYTVYAHLSSRSVGWQIQRDAGTTNERPNFAASGAPGVARATQAPIPITKGTQIGTMGNTGTTSSFRLPANRRNKYSGTHLHFEVDTVFPPRNDAITPRISRTTNPSRPPIPDGFRRSLDPVAFFQEAGVDLVQAVNNGGTITEEESNNNSEPLDDDRADPVHDSDQNRPREDVLAENNAQALPSVTPQTQMRGSVDNSLTRSQALRWALLQDHWYQHNLEYLSGRIDMRGAPEIRVGYRLDLFERNMSFYVEGVNHSWQYPQPMTTSLSVTRGQPNCPFPLYVMPKLEAFSPTNQQRRTAQSRLATYFLVPDVLAVRRAMSLYGSGFQAPSVTSTVVAMQDDNYLVNAIDNTVQSEDGIDEVYNEKVVPANSRDASSAIEQESQAEALRKAETAEPVDSISGLDPGAMLTEDIATLNNTGIL